MSDRYQNEKALKRLCATLCQRIIFRASHLAVSVSVHACVCICRFVHQFPTQPSGLMVAGTSVLEQRYGYVSTHNESPKKKESIYKVMENWSKLSFIPFFFSIGFIFLYSSVLSIQGSPTSLSFTLFHQMILFHMRWFHSEHPLTVNLHTLTLQIHHHTGYV